MVANRLELGSKLHRLKATAIAECTIIGIIVGVVIARRVITIPDCNESATKFHALQRSAATKRTIIVGAIACSSYRCQRIREYKFLQRRTTAECAIRD